VEILANLAASGVINRDLPGFDSPRYVPNSSISSIII